MMMKTKVAVIQMLKKLLIVTRKTSRQIFLSRSALLRIVHSLLILKH